MGAFISRILKGIHHAGMDRIRKRDFNRIQILPQTINFHLSHGHHTANQHITVYYMVEIALS